MRVLLSEQADADLLRICAYRAERNPAAATRLANAFDRTFANLVRFPFIGRDRSNLSKGIRSVITDTYVIFYRVDPDRLLIVRILDGHRDIDAEFRR